MYKISALMGNSPDICRRHYARFQRWKVDGVLQPIGLRTLEVEITSDVDLEALYTRSSRLDPAPPTEDDGDME